MLDDVNEQHLLYALLMSLIEDMGGVAKISTEYVVDMIKTKNKSLGLYENENYIYLEVNDEDSSKEIV